MRGVHLCGAASPHLLAGLAQRSQFLRSCLQGLPGAEQCEGYKFVEQRGGWEAEAQRLEKQQAKHSKSGAKASFREQLMVLMAACGRLCFCLLFLVQGRRKQLKGGREEVSRLSLRHTFAWGFLCRPPGACL